MEPAVVAVGQPGVADDRLTVTFTSLAVARTSFRSSRFSKIGRAFASVSSNPNSGVPSRPEKQAVTVQRSGIRHCSYSR
jgi:hypothetical protein